MHARLLAALIVTSVVASTPLACNVFISIGHCERDDDCDLGGRCDLVGRFCVNPHVENEASAPDAALEAEAAAEASAPACDVGAPFTTIARVRGFEDVDVFSARLVGGEKTMVFSGYDGCREESCIDLRVAVRSDTGAAFTLTGPLQGVNTSVASEYWPTLTADGNLLFFESSRSLVKVDGGYVNDRSRIWTATRQNSVAQFGVPFIQEIFEVDDYESSPYLHPNGGSVYFASATRARNKGRLDIFVAQLDSLGGASSVENVDAVNTADDELVPVISFDERAMYFAREADNVRRIMLTRRTDPKGVFGPPVAVTELNERFDWPSWLSDDACRLYFVRALDQDAGGFGAYRLWLAERQPAR